MNIHLMIDDKFIDGFIQTAEMVAPGMNRYVFTFSPPGKYVKSSLGIYAPFGSKALQEAIENIKIEDKVFVHWFSNPVYECIEKLDARIKVYLFFWGGDFFEQSERCYNFNLDPITKQYWNKVNKYAMFHLSKNPLSYLEQLRLFITVKGRMAEERRVQVDLRRKFLQRLNYFCHWNTEDFDRLKEEYPSNAQFLPFFYDARFDLLPAGFGEKKPKKENNDIQILLGNSATAPNNHLDAFEQLKKYKNRNISILCPLSYGNKQYGNKASKVGKRIFGKKFSALRSFMPIQEYYSLLRSVDVVVMYHNRSQAAGNVFAFLFLRKKVFLKGQSSIFSYLKRNGIVVYDSNDLNKMTFESFCDPIPDKTLELNRNIISELFSENNKVNYLRDILLN